MQGCRYPSGERWEEIVECKDVNLQSLLIEQYVFDLQDELRKFKQRCFEQETMLANLKRDIKDLKKISNVSDKDVIIQAKAKDLFELIKKYGDKRENEGYDKYFRYKNLKEDWGD